MVILTVLKLCIRFLMHGCGVTHVRLILTIAEPVTRLMLLCDAYIYGPISMSYCLLGRVIFFLPRLFITKTCTRTDTRHNEHIHGHTLTCIFYFFMQVHGAASTVVLFMADQFGPMQVSM